jgi:archaellum component FlaF (FlaF/FlaG flagellin family)
MIPPQLMIIAAQYGTKILAVLILIASLVAGYYYWKHEVTSEAYGKAVDQCNLSREKFRIDAEHFKLARAEEVDKANKQQTERVQNAVKKYIEHYESIRNTPVASSLRIKADCAVGTGSDALPGTNQSRSQAAGGIGGTGTAELSAGSLRQFNKVIEDIERMELKCEQLLNSVP